MICTEARLSFLEATQGTGGVKQAGGKRMRWKGAWAGRIRAVLRRAEHFLPAASFWTEGDAYTR